VANPRPIITTSKDRELEKVDPLEDPIERAAVKKAEQEGKSPEVVKAQFEEKKVKEELHEAKVDLANAKSKLEAISKPGMEAVSKKSAKQFQEEKKELMEEVAKEQAIVN
jgi:hypothetical protein